MEESKDMALQELTQYYDNKLNDKGEQLEEVSNGSKINIDTH